MVCNSAYLPGLGPLPLRELDLGNGDAVLYYLEEFIPGTPLHQVAKPLTVEAVLDMGRSVAMALNEIWKNGYIHRDVKPLNIIQRTSGGYVLLDTGLALDFAASSITPMGGVVGTPAYLSPDQLQIPKRELDFRSDLFSLGITMYECATGQHPFWNPLVPTGDVRYNIVQSPCPHPQRWNNSLPDGLCEAILRMLEKERHLRYSRIEHLLEDLDKVTP